MNNYKMYIYNFEGAMTFLHPVWSEILADIHAGIL